jgi:hypothetical protein
MIRIVAKSRDLQDALAASIAALEKYPGARWATRLPTDAQLEHAHRRLEGLCSR